MADEPTKTTEAPQEPTLTQEQVDKIVSDRLARERAKYQDYDTVKSELEKLASEKKQREEAKKLEEGKYQELLSEKEKLIAEREEKIAALSEKATKYDAWLISEEERIEASMADLDDADKDLVKDAPLTKRMALIQRLKAASETRPTPPGGRGNPRRPGAPDFAAVEEIKMKFGAHSKQYRDAYSKYRETQSRR